MSDERIVGGRQLDEFLKTLAPKVEKNIMRSALRAGAAVYRAKTMEYVPVRLGDLRKSVRISAGSKGGKVTASVKVGNRKAWYGPLVEFGTQPHKIKPKDARALEIGGTVVREVDHPGATPHPFMRPAADASHAAATAAVATKIRQRLTLLGIDVPAPEEV